MQPSINPLPTSSLPGRRRFRSLQWTFIGQERYFLVHRRERRDSSIMKTALIWFVILGMGSLNLGSALATSGCLVDMNAVACCCGPDSACSIPSDESGINPACCDLTNKDATGPAPLPCATLVMFETAKAPIRNVAFGSAVSPGFACALSTHPKAPPCPAYTLLCAWLI